jgi:hypothetical protein
MGRTDLVVPQVRNTRPRREFQQARAPKRRSGAVGR